MFACVIVKIVLDSNLQELNLWTI